MRETEPIPITIEYRLTEEGAEILRLHGRAAEIRIPECIAGVPVASIAERAFAVQAEVPETDAEERPALLSFSTEGAEPAEKEQPLKRLFLPDTVRHIGAYAFAGCSALEHLHLPEEHLRGVHNSRVCTVRVEYGGAGKPMCLTSDGRAYEVSELVGDIYLSGAPRSSRLAAVLGRSGFFVNEEAVELMCQEADLEMEFESHGKCRIGQPAGVSPEWREYAIEKLYSYALPFTVDMKITKETVDWIEQEGMLEVVAFEKDLIDRNEVFHLEAYLPTEYDSKQRTLTTNGEVHGEEIMFTRKVDQIGRAHV